MRWFKSKRTLRLERQILEAERLLRLDLRMRGSLRETLRRCVRNNERLRGLVQEMLDAEESECETEWGHAPPCVCEWCKDARLALAGKVEESE